RLRAAQPSTFLASRTARWASPTGTKQTGSGLTPTRPDDDPASADQPSRPAHTPDTRSSAMGSPRLSPRRSSDRTQGAPAGLPRVPDRDDLLRIVDRFALGFDALRLFRSSGGGSFALLAAAVRSHGARSYRCASI